MKLRKFFSYGSILSEEEKKKKKIEYFKTEIVLLLVSFALPFVMAILYWLVTGLTLADVYAHAYRFAIIGGMFFFVFNAIVAYYFFGHRSGRNVFKEICVVAIGIVFTYVVGVVFAAFISVFIAPLCLVGLLIAVLVDNKLAIFVNTAVVVAFYFGYSAIQGTFEWMIMLSAVLTQTVSGSFLILMGKRVYTRLTYFADSLFVCLLVAFPVAFLSGLIHVPLDVVSALKNGMWSFVSVLFSLGAFMIILPVFEYFFSMYSNFRLDELCSPEAKLMSRLAKEAPGTYNHSLAMANLAQACAIAIGENATLARAAACYHDVGKLENPICFTENQTDRNPHDDYIPEVSVSIITKHTKAGADMIRKEGLPEALAQVAEEHHGTQTVGFFLNKTRGFTDEQLANSDFSYDGPKPSTKISGLIMIVDTVEAATRAQGIDKDNRNFTAFIHRLIMGKMDAGQFSECPLTLKDLQIIEETLVKTLPSLYHQRIKYTK